MRLAEFIRSDMEPILKDWEAFAKTLLAAEDMNKTGLRDHAKDMLLEIADDLDSYQSESAQAAKSKGIAPAEAEESWAEIHGSDRQTSGFSVMETVSEFRALRASVVSLWTKANPSIAGDKLEDLTRFHEAIDQAVAESLQHYAVVKEMETRLFGAILLASPDPIYVLDLEGRFVYANKATANLFGLAHKAIIGKTTFELGFPFAADFQHNLKKVIVDQSTFRGKFVHTFASGNGEQFEYLLAPVLDENNETEATVCISRDVTEQAVAAEKIWYNAHYDLLTGLPNRRLFLDRLEQEVKHAKRSGLPLAVFFMDLDGFKEVNDALGHDAGDHLLAAVAKRLTESVREEDTVARLGGDEFTVILSGAKQHADVELVAQTIIDALATPFQIAQDNVQISVSLGIALYAQDATSPASLLQAADHAMYKAKKAGANQMCFFEKAADQKEQQS
ncbi:PAS domain S-box-containing protein/diguanylate cyclase (GGDEF) domain-containing protein [Arsukibacterium tuosuense]|uniref:PAS domain S-box-containing protein/diguanylate cyclase (GGDEF) domain-containing protein n=2 Tax=Arsukibacterium tuosuense TaxID=1323745 RepID=A0A285J444_9GAMM|nr:diguanylate cyclase [Arsukibacterium tuosuense]SNY53871.1 PAS domain S-box-containing protein/diguanylate cyclase (GGDEF) domain-containing protein [Arsukibacterium tuosuense]